ncbi:MULTISPECIES: cysteine desulfurase family protein [unclassified Ruegeria]|uniref:cysteine desulfurase family protein n=1 Tax=unclassified Ruegeria TaxID=2625375 RepID=UPI0014909E7B|nr:MULTISPECIES: cysteine desulfurase family protein [unclassified Ruegeria]NOD36648.1 aminotransferase class V-fold PLP-dependent enzyme [Ruegeria sp. HKCCD7296]NOE43853.1 aminotransferase class V-fold PLP-dependent enzyme [Ruegeria sp. HKCCD7319]
MRPEIYLDNNATTRPLASVADAVNVCLTENFGNPSSPHARGRRARQALETARQSIAELMSTDLANVIFTSGATEANNTVISAALSKGQKIVCTSGEHPSVESAAKYTDHDLIEVGLDSDGVVNLAALREALNAHPRSLVAMHWANGETGVLQPVDEVCELATYFGAKTLFDGAQAVGRVPRDELSAKYSFLSFSSHKLHGPQGVGVLCLGDNSKVTPLISGGGQERGLRSGTENLPGAVGFGVACRERRLSLEGDLEHLRQLRDTFEAALSEGLEGIRINGKGARRVPNTSNITFHGVDGQALAARLDAENVICSQVSACSSARPSPSRTLMAMGISEEEAFSSLRFSFSILNTMEDALEAADIVSQEARFLREVLGCVQ